MDTLKSIAVVALLGAVLYGVYVTANKPEVPRDSGFAKASSPANVETPIVDVPRRNPEPGPLAESTAGFAEPIRSVDSPRLSLPSSAKSSSNNEEAALSVYAAPATNSNASESDSTSNSLRSRDPFSAQSKSAPPLASAEDQGSLRRSIYEKSPHDSRTAENMVASSQSGTALSERNQREASAPSAVSSKDAEIAAADRRVRVYAFHQAWKAAQDQVQEGRYREALAALSAFSHDDAIPESERKQLQEWLDALAGKVIYGTEHLLEEGYVCRRGDTLYTIAEKYGVPFMLLKNINGIRDPEILLPGQKIKVISGPFQAIVEPQRGELTLFVQNLYAGRFPIERGQDPVKPGEYTVREKRKDRAYYGTATSFQANDPRNPYGGVWIDLGNEVCLHGSPADPAADTQLGCIGLAQRDAEDLYGILSVGSKVMIR